MGGVPGKSKWHPAHVRFARSIRFVVRGDHVCWEFTGGTCNGYGKLMYDGGHLAHRYVWEMLNGKLPSDIHLHHKCENKSCVNPNHLQPLTQPEHRAQHVFGYQLTNGSKTHCPRGHEYSHVNSEGRRCCRICQREQLRASRARRKAMAVATQ